MLNPWRQSWSNPATMSDRCFWLLSTRPKLSAGRGTSGTSRAFSLWFGAPFELRSSNRTQVGAMRTVAHVIPPQKDSRLNEGHMASVRPAGKGLSTLRHCLALFCGLGRIASRSISISNSFRNARIHRASSTQRTCMTAHAPRQN